MARRSVKSSTRKYPRSWKKKKYVRKRTYAKKRVSRYITNSTSIGGMPDGKIVKMPYNETSTFNSFGGAQSFGVLNIMSIYDPLVSGSGTNHQPFGRDEMKNFYKRYLVLGAKVVSTFTWNAAPGDVAVQCFSLLDEDNTLPSLLHTKKERYPAKVKLLLPDKSKRVVISNYYSASKWHKINKSALAADHQMSSIMEQSPAKQTYLNFGVQSADSASSSGVVSVDNMIYFCVKLLDPQPILGS